MRAENGKGDVELTGQVAQENARSVGADWGWQVQRPGFRNIREGTGAE